MENRFKLGRYVIAFQGFYYILTGLWALISLESFNVIVGHVHENNAFEMHSIAAMAVVLGLYYTYSVMEKDWFKNNFNIVYLVIGINLSIILVELFYFNTIKPTLFLLDFAEEIVITILLIFAIKRINK